MIEAYIDESGTHDQATIITMAGFLSSYKRWRKFDREWDAILNPPNETPPPPARRVFHATDCLGKDGYKSFAGWSKEARDALVERLIPIARARSLFGFAAAFSLRDYNEIVPERIRRKWKHPYYLCMFHIANLLKVNKTKFSFGNEKISFVFAHKPKFVGLLDELYEELRRTEAVGDILGKMIPYGEPAKNLPLQAADLLNYLIRTFWEKEHFNRESVSRRTRFLLNEIGAAEDSLEPQFLGPDLLRAFVKAYEESREETGGGDMQFNTPKKGRNGR